MQCKENQVKIRVDYVSLGALDYNQFHSKKNREYIPGYEMVGTIVDLGSEAKANGYQIGERVTSLPISYCGTCENCLKGRYNSCINIRENDGVLVEYIERDYRQLFKIPAKFSDITGCAIWPIAEALEAVEASNITINSTVLILGNDFTAMMIARIAKMKMAKLVVMVCDFDVDGLPCPDGVDKIVSQNDLLSTQRELLRDTKFAGFDSVIVAADNKDLEWNFQGFAKPGGTFCLLAFKRLNYGISIGAGGVLSRNLTLVSSYLFNNKMYIASELVSQLSVEKYIEAEFSFANADIAYDSIVKHRYDRIGIVLTPNVFNTPGVGSGI